MPALAHMTPSMKTQPISTRCACSPLVKVRVRVRGSVSVGVSVGVRVRARVRFSVCVSVSVRVAHNVRTAVLTQFPISYDMCMKGHTCDRKRPHNNRECGCKVNSGQKGGVRPCKLLMAA